MYIGHLNFQPKSFFGPYNLRDPFPTLVVVTENAGTQVISLQNLQSPLHPGFTLSTPVSSLPDKVNRGHPSSVKNKHQNTSHAFFYTSHSLTFVKSHSLPVRHTVDSQFVTQCRLWDYYLGCLATQININKWEDGRKSWRSSWPSGDSLTQRGGSSACCVGFSAICGADGWSPGQRAAGLSLHVTRMMWAGSLQALVNTFLYHRLVKGLGETHGLFTIEQLALALAFHLYCSLSITLSPCGASLGWYLGVGNIDEILYHSIWKSRYWHMSWYRYCVNFIEKPFYG